jgi:uncharacterized damage-inducible protein DinB
MSLAAHFRACARNNALSSDRLLRACAQLASDRALIAYCDAQGDAALSRTIGLDRGDEGVFEETLPAVLEHSFTPQIHQRGQVHARLAGMRAAPPQLDEFFLHYDEPRRRDELARLGL